MIFEKVYPDIFRAFEKIVSDQEKKDAYIFFGPKGVGKSEFALLFAKSFLCGTMPNCGFCSQCLYENHPDILIVRKEENDERIKAQTVRESIRFALIPPHTQHKFVIIENAELMTQQGFSALLKAIEESKKFTTFILTTSKIELIPTTIVSRCVKIRFFPNFDLLIDEKIREKEFSESTINIIRNIGYFNPSIINMEQDKIEKIWRAINCIITEDKNGFMKIVNEIKDSDEAREILDALESYIAKNTGKLGKTAIEIWEKIKSARAKIELFINPQLVLLSLIF